MLKANEDVMHVPLARFLTDLPSNDQLTSSDKSALLTRVHLVCPQALLPVLPSLMAQLKGTDGTTHVGVVDLVGQLLTTCPPGLESDYVALLIDLLRCLESKEVCSSSARDTYYFFCGGTVNYSCCFCALPR